MRCTGGSILSRGREATQDCLASQAPRTQSPSPPGRPHTVPAPRAGGRHPQEWRPGRPLRQDPPEPSDCVRLPPRATGSRAESWRPAAASGTRRRPASDYRFTRGARQARPRAAPRPRSPAQLFFSIHADAPGCRRRRRRPSGLAGGRGASTFPRPAARAAHRRRCRRGPGARPGQSGRAGWGGAVAVAGLVSRAGSPAPARRPARRAGPPLPAPACGPQPSSRGADAPPPGRGGAVGAGRGPPRPPLVPSPGGCQSA